MIATEKKCPYCGCWLSFDTRENNFWCELCECTHSIEKIYGIPESVPPIQSRKPGWKTVREITSGLTMRAADGAYCTNPNHIVNVDAHGNGTCSVCGKPPRR